MVSRLLAAILIPVLVFNLAACSTTRSLTLPDAADPERPTVEEGQTVTVVEVDGDRHEGRVISVGPDALVLGAGGNYGWTETSFAYDDIASIEVEERSTLTKTLFYVGLAAFVGLVVVAIANAEVPIPTS